MSRYFLIIITISFVLGALGALVALFVVHELLLLSVVTLLALVSLRKYQASKIVLVVCVGLLLGFLRASTYEVGSSLAVYTNRAVELEARVISTPQVTEKSKSFVVLVTSMHSPEIRSVETTKVLVRIQRYDQINRGDVLRLKGTLEKPQNFRTDNDRTFRYEQFLAKDGVTHTLFFPQLEVVGETKKGLVAVMAEARSAYASVLMQKLPAPESVLAIGITAGISGEMSTELDRGFRNSGLIHIVVLSGFNVAIIVIAIKWLLLFLPKVPRAIITVVAVCLFVMFVGFGATIVRAAIMALIAISADVINRKYSVMHALALACLVMVIHNPLIVAFDPSFQLSFLAALGLIVLAPKIEKYLKWIPEKYGAREVVVATLAAQVAVTPYLLWLMGELAIFALPINALLVPLVPLAMLLVLLTFLTSFVPLVSVIISTLTYVILTPFVRVAQYLANSAVATIQVAQFSFLWVIVTYVLIGLFTHKSFLLIHRKHISLKVLVQKTPKD